MVADNDEATGRFIDALSHSDYWASSMVFVIEDDPQDGGDHVELHRSPCLVISPWVKRGYTSSVHYDVPGAVAHASRCSSASTRSTSATATRAAMYDLFADQPDLTPYTFIPRKIPETHQRAPTRRWPRSRRRSTSRAPTRRRSGASCGRRCRAATPSRRGASPPGVVPTTTTTEQAKSKSKSKSNRRQATGDRKPEAAEATSRFRLPVPVASRLLEPEVAGDLGFVLHQERVISTTTSA